MPKGPRGEKRPADVIGAAVKVMKIVRLGAIQAALDRGWGKPAQAVPSRGIRTARSSSTCASAMGWCPRSSMVRLWPASPWGSRWWPSRAQTTRIARYRGDGAAKVLAGAENAIAVSGTGGLICGETPLAKFSNFFLFFTYPLTRTSESSDALHKLP